MRRPDFGRPVVPLVPQHLHDDSDAIDRDVAKGLQHGLPAELELELEAIRVSLESTFIMGE